jgi:hypothetical protein
MNFFVQAADHGVHMYAKIQYNIMRIFFVINFLRCLLPGILCDAIMHK